MNRKSRTSLAWHIAGLSVIAIWVVLVGLLIRKVHFSGAPSDQYAEPIPAGIEEPVREWKEIFLQDRKVGYSINHIRPVADGYIIQEEIFLKLDLMGLSTGVHTNTFCVTDDNFLLRTFRFRMTSGAMDFRASGAMEGDRLVVTTGRDENKRTQSIPMENRPVMGASLAHYFVDRGLRVGETFSFPVFDPSTMSRRNAQVRVVGMEDLSIKGISYHAFRIEADLWGDTLTFWLDEQGKTLKESGFMGLTAVRSSAAAAPENIQGSGDIDFYEIAAVKPDRLLPRERSLSFLKVRLGGMEGVAVERVAWNGDRQSFADGVMEIRRETPPFAAGYVLPFADPNGDFEKHLLPEINIESDHPEVVAAAREIAGGEKDPLKACRRVLAWTHENLEKRPVVSIPSALETLHSRVGDCNEHATLTAALLRALGIPSRLAVGLVYMRGKFFYHAWNEAYTGRWISMDAVMNQMPVDASHIKLLEGNLDKQVEIAGLIGKLELKILDYAHD